MTGHQFLALVTALHRHHVSTPSRRMTYLVHNAVQKQEELWWSLFIRGICTKQWQKVQQNHDWQHLPEGNRGIDAWMGMLVYCPLHISLLCWKT